MEIVIGIVLIACAFHSAKKRQWLVAAALAFLGVWLAIPSLLQSEAFVALLGSLAALGAALWGLRRIVS